MKYGYKVGLALGGGAARALSHIGIIEELERHGISIDILTGTSMGAIIGALYASHGDIGAVRQRMEAYLQSQAFRESRFDFMKEDAVEGEGIFFRFSQFMRKGYFYSASVLRTSFVTEEIARANFSQLIEEGRIEDLQIPFAAVALDLISGKEVVLDEGDLYQAITATCALPGILPPVERPGQMLVDGGWIDAVPVDAARQLGADFVIAVDVSSQINEYAEPDNGMDIVFRADAITRYALSDLKLRQADFVLSPQTSHIHWADFSQLEESIAEGRAEVSRNILSLQKQLRHRRLRRFLPEVRWAG